MTESDLTTGSVVSKGSGVVIVFRSERLTSRNSAYSGKSVHRMHSNTIGFDEYLWTWEW